MLQAINPFRSSWHKPVLALSSLALGTVVIFANAIPAAADTVIIRRSGTIRVTPSIIYDYGSPRATTIFRTTRYCYPYYGVTPVNERPTAGLVNCSSTSGSTLVNPVVVDSTIIDSTLINPVIIDSNRVNTTTIRVR